MLSSAASLLPLALDVPRWAIELAFGVYALAVTTLVILERRRPTATLALVLALVFLPVAGLVVYLVLTQRVRRRIRRRLRRPINPVDDTRDVANLEELPADGLGSAQGLVRLALQSAAAPLRRSESVTLLPRPDTAFDAFADAITGAQRTIHCEFYIWRDDRAGRRITQMLAERAAAGVKVRVLYDHLGSLGLPRTHFDALREAGGQVAVFGRLRIPLRLSWLRVDFRNHRKLMTVDGQRGFLGGLNVGDEYLDPQGKGLGWRDLAVDLRGDAVVGLEAIFLEDWLASTGEVLDLQGERTTIPRRFDPRRPLPTDRPWQRRRAQAARARAMAISPFAPRPDLPVTSAGPLLQIIPSGPDLPLVSVIAAQLSAAIAGATSRVWLATPYFVPDEPLLFILRVAALKGIDLRILVPAPHNNDVRLVAWAARSYYDDVLAAGGRIFEYQPSMMHSKYLIVDELCAIGSANMDVRSFHINYEVTGMFYDSALTAELAALFQEDLGRAREVTRASRARLTLPVRLTESTARVLSPLL
ncbi:phospholipase D-like domain-containing protein [Paraliomyxa miuraensis]|uniref:phospholipase D-like domain-containing protein n=1 Tax=Paraliomyxa miuraensis TaxID=376150 RepID=UPI0022599836|nr:phospholipase D-like domain-containing protein [Paraliomyxa miuraensis]MCX4245945.1 phospholipase D-like domain-containing protein [Paraliomyxa miuraensis]